MITLLRIIVISLILYFIFRIFRALKGIFTANKAMYETDVRPKQTSHKIDKDDIIEAKFEEIKPEESKDTKENS